MTSKLDKRIYHHVLSSGGKITPKELFGLLKKEGVLDQETIDNIIIVGPLDEWIEMKIKRANKMLQDSKAKKI